MRLVAEAARFFRLRNVAQFYEIKSVGWWPYNKVVLVPFAPKTLSALVFVACGSPLRPWGPIAKTRAHLDHCLECCPRHATIEVARFRLKRFLKYGAPYSKSAEFHYLRFNIVRGIFKTWDRSLGTTFKFF